MARRHWAAMSVMGVWVAAGLAQNVRWETDVQGAIREAQREQRPLMFHVYSTRYEPEDSDDSIIDRQRRVFADARVALASRQFVPVRLYRERDGQFLEQVGIPSHGGSDFTIFWTTPQGKLLDRISAGGVTQVESMLQKMETIWEKYRQTILDEIKPILGDENAEPRVVVDALRRLEELAIPEADEPVIELLKRESLDDAVRSQGVETLAALNSEKAVQYLFELSLTAKDPRLAREVATRLTRADPPAARHLMKYLDEDDLDQQVAAYDAIAKIARVRTTRPGQFWQSASEDQRKQAFDLLKKDAEERIERWEQRNARRR